MTQRRIVTLDRPSMRKLAHDFIDRAYEAGGYEIEVRKARRSSEQNARMWAMLSTIARAIPERNGIQMTPEDWKTLFMHALNRELRMVPAIDGQGFVPLGNRSSRLTKQEFSDLFEIIEAFAAREGIDLSQQKDAA